MTDEPEELPDHPARAWFEAAAERPVVAGDARRDVRVWATVPYDQWARAELRRLTTTAGTPWRLTTTFRDIVQYHRIGVAPDGHGRDVQAHWAAWFRRYRSDLVPGSALAVRDQLDRSPGAPFYLLLVTPTEAEVRRWVRAAVKKVRARAQKNQDGG